MSGFVDLHLHLLPGIDDGARTMADTLAMARTLVSLGFSVAAPSPHNRSEYAPRELALSRLEEVKAELKAANIALELHSNSENTFLDEQLLTVAPGPLGRRLGAKGTHLLIEAPYTTTLPSLLDIIFRLQVKGVTALVAHPERCLEFERKGRAAEVVRAGGLLQLDIAALIGRYGPQAKKLARSFLDDGLYEVAASDMHSPVGAEVWLAESIAALRKAVGEKSLQALLSTNPRALLL